MDLTVLAKKISSYPPPSGKVTNLPNELLPEILHAWERWSGSALGFYSTIDQESGQLVENIEEPSSKNERLKKSNLKKF